jgi:hypothetical protein
MNLNDLHGFCKPNTAGPLSLSLVSLACLSFSEVEVLRIDGHCPPICCHHLSTLYCNCPIQLREAERRQMSRRSNSDFQD